MFPDVYTGAVQIIAPTKMSAGLMGGPPVGVTVHDLASRNAEASIKYLHNSGLGYHAIIDRNGDFIQTSYFSHKVNHAGRSTWKGHSPNRTHISVALASWGELKEDASGGFMSWANKAVEASGVKLRSGNLSSVPRHWDAATDEQEATLIAFLKWSMANGIDPKNICGHDEAAIPFGRKNDPGGVLSMTMPQLRKFLTGK
jgi:N-acetyl-anhydromuramyl-L-alanine amidase AmpD